MLVTFAGEWEKGPDKARHRMFQIVGELQEDLQNNFVANATMKSETAETIKKLEISLPGP
jgi:hypothetical protein